MGSETSGRPLIIVNPTASKLAQVRRRGGIVSSVVSAVRARTGRDPIVEDSSREAAAIALAAASGSPLVAVVGGDGTIREAATALAGTEVPLGIVPAGTGNAFAAELGVPRRLAGAIALIEHGRPQRVDLGRATWGTAPGPDSPAAGSSAFVVACGMGFDARVMARASTADKRRLGFAAYVLAAVGEAARPHPARFRIDVDGDVRDVEGLVVLVANCGQIVPGLVGPREPIDPTDGFLDVIVVTGPGIVGGLVGAAEALLNSGPAPHTGSRSMRLRARRVRVSADPPEPVEVDGDAHRAGWLEATVQPGAVAILRR